MIGTMFGVTDSKNAPNRDVGTMTFIPENQITVDVVFITAEATTEFCFDQVLNYEYTSFSMNCNPAEMIYITTTDNTADQIIARNQMMSNSINTFSIGDVAVNLGLRSAPKTTSNNLNYQLVCLNSDSQREYRLDIGETFSRLGNNQTYII